MNVIKRVIATVKKQTIPLYFFLLLVLLLWIYFPSFSHPPRSDHWPALYFFYRIDILAQAQSWKFLLTYDPLINVTFRPLSFLIPYFEYRIFGSNFFYSHIINFSLYFISIVLLYKLALNFCKDKMFIAYFLGILACFFSHFDLIAWSFHSHIILSFCLFILGFITYIKYLKTGRAIFLVFVAFLFLLGMLLYEVYLFWPVAIIILNYIDEVIKKNRVSNIKPQNSYLPVIGVVYSFYSIFFVLNSIMRASLGPGISLSLLSSFSSIIKNIFAVFLNILYFNVLINLNPSIAYPLHFDDNLNIGGLIVRYSFALNKIIFLGGFIGIAIFFYFIAYLLRKKRFDILNVFLFFMFLICSQLFILFHCKSLMNTGLYSFIQFRFQYIPNAIFVLVVVFLLDRLVRPSKRKKVIIYFILFVILILNIQATREGISVLDEQLAPLKKILFNIKMNIQNGKINLKNKIFIDDEIALRLPSLCWNKEMGQRCMRGTYQWFFTKEEINCFSTYEEAVWIFNGKKLYIVPK